MISKGQWITVQTFKWSFSFKREDVSNIRITSYTCYMIIAFLMWYIHADPNMNRFFKYFLLFLITILILDTANNLFQLLTGWGDGIIPFYWLNDDTAKWPSRSQSSCPASNLFFSPLWSHWAAPGILVPRPRFKSGPQQWQPRILTRGHRETPPSSNLI